MTNNILSHESHLHLYGCLEAKSFWEVAEKRSKLHSARFQWFLSEFERVTGRVLHPDRWWKSDHGFFDFKQDYICDQPVSFDLFQAKFNLLIALFPPNPDDMWLPEAVFKTHAPLGGYKEYRTFLPLYLPEGERARYLKNVLERAKSFETSAYHPRIAVSLMRKDTEAWEGYRFLRDFLASHKHLASIVTGIDFCASEQGHPPSAKRELFKQVHKDNLASGHSLDILYHVGEMWHDISIQSAARWCVEAAMLKAHRLGHALALGMDVSALRGGKILETSAEAIEHLAWIRKHLHELQEFGFGPSDYQWLSAKVDSKSHHDFVEWHYDDDLIDNTTRFQDAALSMVAQLNPIIESCPTSNMRIGNLKSSEQHPIRRFLKHDLNVVVATDDPGIFDITLAEEEQLLKSKFHIPDETLRNINAACETVFTKS